MIYVLYGVDTYRSRTQLKKFKSRFRKEVPFAWFFVDGKDEESAEQFFTQEGGGTTLFAKKEFGIIENVSELSKKLYPLAESTFERWSKDDSVVVVFEEGIPNEKNTLFSFIKKHATQKEEFAFLKPTELGKFIEIELKNRNATLSLEEKKHIMELCGSDLHRVIQELDRRILGGDDTRALEIPKDQDLFLLGDYWGKRNHNQALLLYERLLGNGFLPERMLWTLLWHVKNLILVMRQETKSMSPYVLRKSKEQAQLFTSDELVAAYDELVRLEDKIVRDQLDVGILKFLVTR